MDHYDEQNNKYNIRILISDNEWLTLEEYVKDKDV